jgi:hypothetical protein
MHNMSRVIQTSTFAEPGYNDPSRTWIVFEARVRAVRPNQGGVIIMKCSKEHDIFSFPLTTRANITRKDRVGPYLGVYTKHGQLSIITFAISQV